ncbi:hypothetical protein NicSoilB4_36950 (plasmid) [Arthrobacter sp. NicSoilB4]|nr:hypothetical protein NicSoilB4_36950 [Arthrobacter sp. NicSoilB4]
MRVGLQGGDKTIDPEGYDAEACPPPGFVFPLGLPDQSGTPYFSDSGEGEQQDGLGYGHDPILSSGQLVAGPAVTVDGNSPAPTA